MPTVEIHVSPDVDAMIAEAAQRIMLLAKRKLADNQHYFSIVLAGGETPRPLYEMLDAEPFRSELNWSKVEVYFTDERCIPPDGSGSNFPMAYMALRALPIPEPNVHRIRGELAPEAAAAEYAVLLREKFRDGGPDLVLLGMGEDGHTASLYPGTTALGEAQRLCVANFVPSLDAWRVTLTYPFLNRADDVIVLVAGPAKAKRVAEVLNGDQDINRLPIQGIQPVVKLTWLLDAAAASMRP